MVKVLDASALIIFIERKSGYEYISQLFLDASQDKYALLISSVNWGEVRYVLMRNYNMVDIEVREILQSLPINIVNVDQEIASMAGDLKIRYKIGYCDAIAAALAKLHQAEFITADRDFNALKNEVKVNLRE